jgi:hypothetical protein
VPLAIDEFPMFFIAAAAARGETRGARGRGTARQGERPAGDHGGRPGRARRRARACCRTACASKAAGQGGPAFGGGRSTATAITASRCRSRSRACAPRIRSESTDTANVATSFPGFADPLGRPGRGLSGRMRPRRDRPSRYWPSTGRRAGKGTISRRVAGAWAGVCWTAARCTGWWPWRASPRGLIPRASRPCRAGRGRWTSVSAPTLPAPSWCARWPGRHRPDPPRGGRAGGLAGRRLAAGAGGAAGAAAGFAEPPGWSRTGGTWGRWYFPAAPLKIFLTASAEERAARRHKQLKDKGSAVSLAALSREIAERDQRDSTRAVAPLKPRGGCADPRFDGLVHRHRGRARARARPAAIALALIGRIFADVHFVLTGAAWTQSPLATTPTALEPGRGQTGTAKAVRESV